MWFNNLFGINHTGLEIHDYVMTSTAVAFRRIKVTELHDKTTFFFFLFLVPIDELAYQIHKCYLGILVGIYEPLSVEALLLEFTLSPESCLSNTELASSIRETQYNLVTEITSCINKTIEILQLFWLYRVVVLNFKFRSSQFWQMGYFFKKISCNYH